MKKFIALCLVVIAMFSFAGCAAGTIPTVPESSKVKLSDIKDEKKAEGDAKAFRSSDLYNMCVQLNKDGHVSDEFVLTNAKIIGAVTGCRFSENVNSSPVNIEIYQFDEKNLNESGKKVTDSVKKDGSFQIFDKTVYNVTMSKNGKYMIIYTDSKTEGDNPADENVKRKENVMKIFNKF